MIAYLLTNGCRVTEVKCECCPTTACSRPVAGLESIFCLRGTIVKTLLRVHRYLGCLLAPMLAFFAISGAWQALDLHETRKDGSYVAPVALKALSNVHMNKRYSGVARGIYLVSVLAMSAAFVVAATIGVVVAFRLARPRWLVGLCLLVGVVLLVYLVAAHEPKDSRPVQAPQSQDAG